MVDIDRIKTVAKIRGIRLSHLCAQMNEDPSYFDKVKKGLRKMDENRVALVADLLHVNPAFLTGESNHWERADSQLSKDTQMRTYFSYLAEPKFRYDRYEERRITRHLLSDYVEAKLEVPHGYMNNVEAGYIVPDEQIINKLAILLNTTVEYLMGQSDDPDIPLNDRTGIKIKVFGEVAAGIPLQQIDNFDPDDADSWEEIDRNTAKNGSYFALRIKGNSMEPRICNGDVVIIREQSTVDSGDIAVVAVNGDTATCKKVVWDAGGGMFLIALNSTYPPLYFSASEIQTKPVTILGKVVELRGKL